MQDFFLSILFENNKLEWLTHIMTSPDTCNIWGGIGISAPYTDRKGHKYLLTSYLVPLRLAVIPCFFLRFFFGAGTAFFSSTSVLCFSSEAGCRALCNREDCVAPGCRAYCVKDVKVTSERSKSVRLFYNQLFFPLHPHGMLIYVYNIMLF